MSAKLTLYIDDNLIAYIKRYAKEQHMSVSKLVNNYLLSLQADNLESISNDEAPITSSLKGVLKNEDIDISDYYKHLEEKYL